MRACRYALKKEKGKTTLQATFPNLPTGLHQNTSMVGRRLGKIIGHQLLCFCGYADSIQEAKNFERACACASTHAQEEQLYVAFPNLHTGLH